jgi:putative endonuclease
LPIKNFYVYILASLTRRLYVGVTNSIDRRIFEHKNKLVEGFTSKYNINRLVYFERFDNATMAIGREKQLKGWRREKKIELINSINPAWKDLSADWYREDKVG